MTDKAPPPDFALALTVLRLSRGWNQDQLAGSAGIANSALSEYERGKKTPELRSLQKITSALGYPLGALEKAEDFLRDLREMGRLEARPGPDGEPSLVPAPPGSAPLAVRGRARRVAALVGQAATAFTLLLFDLLAGAGSPGERDPGPATPLLRRGAAAGPSGPRESPRAPGRPGPG